MFKVNMLDEKRLTEYPTRVSKDYTFFIECGLYLVSSFLGIAMGYCLTCLAYREMYGLA